MPRPTIEYMNARRELKAASGGTNHPVIRNRVDDQAQYDQLGDWDRAMLHVEMTFADFRSWVRNLPPIDQLNATEVPF
jgi:hypothetical protein